MSEHYEIRNRTFWDADAGDYQQMHGNLLAAQPRAWGVWRIPEDELGVLGDTTGLRVLEYGCGAAQWSIALAGAGARVVGLDQSLAQLEHAERARRKSSGEVSLVCASGEHVPFAEGSFDLVFCDHGVMSFCDPYRTVPEVARLLRADGRFVFAHSTPWGYLTWNAKRHRTGRRLREPYFGMRSFDSGEGTVDFQLPYGEWIRLFRTNGFVVDDLVELQAPKGATTTYPEWNPRWARRWPAEQIWKLHRD
jgi:SAM-dependent methyltransferase